MNPVPEPEAPSTATSLVGSYELYAEVSETPYILFTASLPAQYRVHEASCFRRVTELREKLIIRVRQLGEGAVQARFLVVFNSEGRVQLPRVVPSPQDPPDSPMLQWLFWQGCRVGGGLYHDVFDVTHLNLELPS